MFGLLDTRFGARASRFQPDAGAPWSGRGLEEDRLTGFAVGTRLATMNGWRAVETIAVGDTVLTFDHGPQIVRAVTHGSSHEGQTVRPELRQPVMVPAGALGNAAPMLLLPEQSVMIESDVAEEMTGDPFVLLAAKSLIGLRGITRLDQAPELETVTLHFKADELIYADGGALVLAPAAVAGTATVDFMAEDWLPAPYTVVSGHDARVLVELLADEDARIAGEQVAFA